MQLEVFAHSLNDGWSTPEGPGSGEAQPTPSEPLRGSARPRRRPFEFPPLDSPSTLVVAFGAAEYIERPEALTALRRAYPTAQLLGCSTAGEICGTDVRDQSLAVAVARFEHTALRTAFAAVGAAGDSFAAGESLARQLRGPELRAVHVLSEGIQVNGSELVRGFNGVLEGSVAVTGGLAGDGDRFQRTWVLDANGAPRTGCIAAVGLYGTRVRVAHGSKGGWDIFGPQRMITRAEGNKLFELDGKPALQLYKEYLGELASGLPATGLLFPLAISSSKLPAPGPQTGPGLVRTILAIDEASQALIFAGDMPVGWRAQLMRANFDRLIEGAGAAALSATGDDGGGPTLAIAISCVGRRLVLGERTEEEVEATLDVLPAGTRQIGFYSYGEISPLTRGACDLHNQTMTLTSISEA